MTSELLTAAVFLLVTNAPEDMGFGAAEYKQLIIEQRGRIKSMRGSYVLETKPDLAAEQAGLMRNQCRKLKCTFAWSGEKRMRDVSGEYVGPSSKPYPSESVNVYDGKEFRRRLPSKSFLIQQPKSAYSEINNYLSAMKWPITEGELEHSRSKPAESVFLPHFLEADGWRVRGQRELVDNVSCVVLEQAGGPRRLWLDPRRGYCMLRAEHDQPGSAFKQWLTQYRKFREVLPGIYLPMELVGTNIVADSNGSIKGSLITTLAVTDLRVNDVPDSLFVLEPKAGDSVSDLVRNRMYTYAPADDKTLDVSSERSLISMGYTGRRSFVSIFAYFSLALFVGTVTAYGTGRLVRAWRTPSANAGSQS